MYRESIVYKTNEHPSLFKIVNAFAFYLFFRAACDKESGDRRSKRGAGERKIEGPVPRRQNDKPHEKRGDAAVPVAEAAPAERPFAKEIAKTSAFVEIDVDTAHPAGPDQAIGHIEGQPRAEDQNGAPEQPVRPEVRRPAEDLRQACDARLMKKHHRQDEQGQAGDQMPSQNARAVQRRRIHLSQERLAHSRGASNAKKGRAAGLSSAERAGG